MTGAHLHLQEALYDAFVVEDIFSIDNVLMFTEPGKGTFERRQLSIKQGCS